MPPWFWTLSAALPSAASVASTLAAATWRGAVSSPSASATAAKVVSERATSARTAMLAQRCFTAWKEPIGGPNCCRTLAYSTESSSVRSATPSASAAASRVASARNAAASASSGAAAIPAKRTSPRRRVGSMLGRCGRRRPRRSRSRRQGGDGADLDPRRVHRADDPGDAAVARRLGVGAHEELLELRHLREAGPHLLPADDQEIALDGGARLEAGQVGARVRLREALAPDHLAAQDRREMRRPLPLRPARDERRAGVVEPDEERRDVGRAGARVLLAPDELLHERRAAAAVRARPRDAGPAAVVHAPLPGLVVRGARAELRRARRARHVRLEPGARRGAKGRLGRAEAEVHGALLGRRVDRPQDRLAAVQHARAREVLGDARAGCVAERRP